MFKRLLEDLGEVLAPTHRSPLDHFKHNWRKVYEYVIDEHSDSNGDEGVESTPIPDLLHEMIVLLTEEEVRDGGTGPCMEYLLGHGVLRTTVSLAQGDFPRGMMTEIIKFQTKLFTRLKQVLLAHQNVYGPLKILMQVCSQLNAKGTATPEYYQALTEFLVVVCHKVQEQPFFGDLFLEQPGPAGSPRRTSSSSPGQQPDFVLLSLLLTMMSVKESELRRKIQDCITVCLTLPSPSVANVVVNNTAACTILAQRWMQLYAALPPQIDDDDTHSHIMEWTNARIDNWSGWQDSYKALTPDTQAFMHFMDWLHFIDAIAWKALPVISQALTAHIVSQLTLVVEPMLSQQAEQVALTTTVYITACITQISAPVLLQGFVNFLVAGAAPAVDGADSATDAQKLSKILITRCDDMSDELSAASLYLFCQLLSRKNEKVLNGLALGHIEQCQSPGAAVAGKEALLDASEKLLKQIPDHLKSADDESSFRMYFIDAQERASACMEACQQWSVKDDFNRGAGARKAQVAADVSGDGAASEPAGDGGNNICYRCRSPLITILISRLRQMLNQPFHLNLLVTAMLSSLLEYPHEKLHQCLYGSEPNGLMAVMTQLCGELKARAGRIDNVNNRLNDCRQTLTRGTAAPGDVTMPFSDFLHAMIVFEDFTKELVARAIVHTNDNLLG